MSPDANEDPAPREAVSIPSSQVDQNPSGGSGDYFTRGDYGSARFQSDRGSRTSLERNCDDRKGRIEMLRVDMRGESPYGPYRGFFSSARYDSAVRPFGYERMGRFDRGSPLQFRNRNEFERYEHPGNFGSRRGYESGYRRKDYENIRPDYGSERYLKDYNRYGYGGDNKYGEGYISGYERPLNMYSYGRRGDSRDRYDYNSYYKEVPGSPYNRAQEESSYRGLGNFGRFRRDYEGFDKSFKDPRYSGYQPAYDYSRDKDSYRYQKFGYPGSNRPESNYNLPSIERYRQKYSSHSSNEPSQYSRNRGDFDSTYQQGDSRRGYSGPHQGRYERAPYDSSRGFGGRSSEYGQGYSSFRSLYESPMHQIYKNRFEGLRQQPGCWGYERYPRGPQDNRRYHYGFDGDRYRNQYGRGGPNFRSGQSGFFEWDRAEAPPPFPSFSQSRSYHPTSFVSTI